jgi:AcrR family transcriptional regulator
MTAHRPPRPLESVATPKQARSRETLERILVVAEQLIAEKGLADASVPEIARRAGSSVGGFYARFKDKDGLVRALEERFFHEMRDRVDALAQAERWVSETVPVIIGACADELVTVVRERRNLIAAFLNRATQNADTLAGALRFRTDVSQRISGLLLPRRDEIGHPDPPMAIDLAVQFALALMLQVVLIGDVRAGGRVLADQEIQAEVVRNFLAYLGVSVPSSTA